MFDMVEPHSVPDASVDTVPTPIKRETALNARDELAIVCAQKVVADLPQLVKTKCTGCAFCYDKNTIESAHEVCTLPRKKRIDLFAEQILLSADESLVREQLAARFHHRNVLFDAKSMHVEVVVLLANKKWMNKMKRHALDM